MAAGEGGAGEGDDGHPHPQRLTGGEASGIAEGVEGDVYPVMGGERVGVGRTVKLRPDHKLVYYRSWETAPDRLAGVRRLTADLARIAAG
jgi:hypothetical protein